MEKNIESSRALLPKSNVTESQSKFSFVEQLIEPIQTKEVEETAETMQPNSFASPKTPSQKESKIIENVSNPWSISPSSIRGTHYALKKREKTDIQLASAVKKEQSVSESKAIFTVPQEPVRITSETKAQKPDSMVDLSINLPTEEKFTVPEPFEFDARHPKEWISKKRFKQMMEEIKIKENRWNGYIFRARSLPKSTNEPRYSP